MGAGLTYDGRTRMVWLAANPVDLDAPTMAEITGGTDLSGYLVPGSFNPNDANARANAADSLTSFDAESPGRTAAKPTAAFKSKLASGGGTVAWDTLGARLIEGCLLFFEDVAEGSAIAAADECDVYPSCLTGEPRRPQVADNTERRFEVDFFCGDKPHKGAVVAA
jgi:hypothetical protein